MDSFRFVHAADLHIDSPFSGIGEVDGRVATRLREATYEAFQNLVDLCINREADFLDALAACRESLSERQDRILDMRYRESLSFSEIASRMEGTADAVRLMASRSRLALRVCFPQSLAPS